MNSQTQQPTQCVHTNIFGVQPEQCNTHTAQLAVPIKNQFINHNVQLQNQIVNSAHQQIVRMVYQTLKQY